MPWTSTPHGAEALRPAREAGRRGRRAVSPITNAMTVDVEEYFHDVTLDGSVRREMWDRFPSRLSVGLEHLLERLAAHDVQATFFVLGWIAERHPAWVRRIAAAGHEIGSRGYGRDALYALDARRLRSDVVRARALLQDLSGQPVPGYRAPDFSMTAETIDRTHAVLAEVGHRYSSSIVPTRYERHGLPGAPRFAHRRCANLGDLVEIPMASVCVGARALPCSGGTWFRRYPYWWTRFAIGRVNRNDGEHAVFHVRPWEFDPEQPRVTGLHARARFCHYVNLGATATRFDRLLRDFRWGRVDRLFLRQAPPIGIGRDSDALDIRLDSRIDTSRRSGGRRPRPRSPVDNRLLPPDR